MIDGTSTVSPAPWQQTQSNLLPSRASHYLASPTVFSHIHRLQPRATASPACCSPNEVVIDLSTTLVIPDYDRYYSIPIESFQPTYYALADASLITPPFMDDLVNANVSLLVTGMITMLFVRNIFVSGDYIRRGKVKRKTLFYILFLSQMLAPISLIPMMMSYFNQTLDCTVTIIVSSISASLSLALLITGILGVKAYKCLNNSRLVFAALGLFQCASTVIIVYDVVHMEGKRRLSGSCIRTGSLGFTRVYVMIQLVESLFICCCFMYACWKLRGSPAARGRISIQLSMEDLPINIQDDTIGEKHPTRRGWWDYVPSSGHRDPQPVISAIDKTTGPSSEIEDQLNSVPSHKSSSREFSSSQLPRPSTVRISDSPPQRSGIVLTEVPAIRGRISPVPSSFSRLSRLIPRIDLFRQVMRDELFYTTFITATSVIVAVFVFIGVNLNNGLAVTGWIGLHWGIISVLAIHSFGRVVRRHEKDALQHSMYGIGTRAIKTNSEICRSKSCRPRTPSGMPSHMRFRRYPTDSTVDHPDDPFSDTRGLGESRSSWNSAGFVPPSPVNSRPSLVTLGSFMMELSQNIPVILPSPNPDSSSFPTSGHGTPLVPHDSLDGSHIQGFSQSWLVGHGLYHTSSDGKSESNVR